MSTGRDFTRGPDRHPKMLNLRALRFTGNASKHGPVTHIDPATIDPIQPPTPSRPKMSMTRAKKLRRQARIEAVGPPNKRLIAHQMKPYQGTLPQKPEHKRPETTAKPANNKGKTPENRA